MRTCQPGSPARAEHAKPFHYVSMVVVLLSTSACQTSPVAPSGYLSTYAGVVPQSGRAAKKKGARKHRDDAASDAIQSVYIEPAVLALKVQTELSDKEKGMVLRELDRQICFEVSERFLIASAPSPEAGTIRTAVVQLRSTERIGSIAAAAVDYFNPLPLINFRVPGTTGGLGVETELVNSSGRQVAALLWNRRTGFLGGTDPSLSRAGDALQIAEPLGDAVGKAFATKKRPKIKIHKPDPCERFGSRRNISRMVANGLVGNFTGLYAPQIAGTSNVSDKTKRKDRKEGKVQEQPTPFPQ
jgi:hypothetical protein